MGRRARSCSLCCSQQFYQRWCWRWGVCQNPNGERQDRDPALPLRSLKTDWARAKWRLGTQGMWERHLLSLSPRVRGDLDRSERPSVMGTPEGGWPSWYPGCLPRVGVALSMGPRSEEAFSTLAKPEHECGAPGRRVAEMQRWQEGKFCKA